MNNSDWYWILIPFFIYTTGQGVIGPAMNVMQLEPYAEKAGAMAGIGMFWMFITSHLCVIIVTQLLSDEQVKQPVVIHFTIMITGLVIFILGTCFLSKRSVSIRMQRHIAN